MDFLDPKKQKLHERRLIIGYVFITIALLFVMRFMFYWAHGFGLSKNGQVVQSGFVFVASTPAGADITVDSITAKAKTNTRLSLVSGRYNLTLSRNGYYDWHQSFSVLGDSVLRLDYAFLFPTKLATKNVGKAYDAAPAVATQSPDRRWLLVQTPGSDVDFDLYDLKPTTPVATKLVLPAPVISAGTTQAWALVEWSDDNQHVLLSRTYDNKTEYILVDRTDATKTVNINQTLALNPTKLTLLNKKYDQYYVYDATTHVLQTVRLSDPKPQPFLDNVLAYQSYGSNVMLYVSSKSATDGKVAVDLLQGGKTYLLREVVAGSNYVLNLTQYDGSWYVAAGASSEDKVYIYKNPADQLNSSLAAAVPIHVLRTKNPNYLAFSSNARFIMSESGSDFSVFDAEYDRVYHYDTKQPLDAPQQHASWMDGQRIDYVSGGKLVVFDFDNTNLHSLMPAHASYTPFFSSDYKYVNVLAPGTSPAQTVLTSTPLRTPADL